MGWDVGSTGLRIVLDAAVPDLVRALPREDVDGFLADHGLARDDIEWYVATPAARRCWRRCEDALGLPARPLRLTWDSLRRIGNLSSASVLHVLADTLRDRPPRPGSYGLMLAMGPGFLLRAGAAADVGPRMTALAWSSRSWWPGRSRAAGRAGVSKRNAAWSLAHGGVETGRAHYAVMVVLHTGLLVGLLVEAWVRRPDVHACCSPASHAGAGAGVPGAALVVHRDARAAWNTRVIVVPGPAAGDRPVPTASWPTPTTSPSSSRASRCRWCTPPGSPRWSSRSRNAVLLSVRLRVENAALADLSTRSRARRDARPGDRGRRAGRPGHRAVRRARRPRRAGPRPPSRA